MRELLAHAATLGVGVHVAHLTPPYRGFYDHDQRSVYYDFNLTPIERRSVLAHELGHAYYGHAEFGVKKFEEAADYYAACLLIDPAEHAKAEQVDPARWAIAEELEVEERLVRVFEERALMRLGDVTYARPRFGLKQFKWAMEA